MNNESPLTDLWSLGREDAIEGRPPAELRGLGRKYAEAYRLGYRTAAR